MTGWQKEESLLTINEATSQILVRGRCLGGGVKRDPCFNPAIDTVVGKTWLSPARCSDLLIIKWRVLGVQTVMDTLWREAITCEMSQNMNDSAGKLTSSRSSLSWLISALKIIIARSSSLALHRVTQRRSRDPFRSQWCGFELGMPRWANFPDRLINSWQHQCYPRSSLMMLRVFRAHLFGSLTRDALVCRSRVLPPSSDKDFLIKVIRFPLSTIFALCFDTKSSLLSCRSTLLTLVTW